MFNKKSHIHFIGIGGIGMSGIAKIIAGQGYSISGCDKDLDQQSIYDLKSLGCAIYEGNNRRECHDSSIDILVYSSAISPQSPEILAAQQRNIPTIPRALMLAELMRTKYSIAIAGSHGKTTTTSLIAHVLLEAHHDPTVIIGGHLKNISANAQLGQGDFLVAETDESDRSLARLKATIAIITNIDYEHVDTYKDLDDVKGAFLQFLNNLPFYGFAILCIDNPHLRSLLPLSHLRIIKYGLEDEADISAENVTLEPDQSHFTVIRRSSGTVLGPVTLTMPGKHNVLNALATITLALELDIPFETIAVALKNFKGIERRFSFRGTFQGAEIFDDYGHHPEEIRNTLLVAAHRAKKNLHAVFQPHRYTRTHVLWNDFVDLFVNSSLTSLIITDIYPASEPPIAEVTAQNLVRAIKRRHVKFPVFYVPLDAEFKAIRERLGTLATAEDLILLQGAGKINKISDYF